MEDSIPQHTHTFPGLHGGDSLSRTFPTPDRPLAGRVARFCQYLGEPSALDEHAATQTDTSPAAAPAETAQSSKVNEWFNAPARPQETPPASTPDAATFRAASLALRLDHQSSQLSPGEEQRVTGIASFFRASSAILEEALAPTEGVEDDEAKIPAGFRKLTEKESPDAVLADCTRRLNRARAALLEEEQDGAPDESRLADKRAAVTTASDLLSKAEQGFVLKESAPAEVDTLERLLDGLRKKS